MSKTLEDLVNEVDYTKFDNGYSPSLFALKFITFIKLVNGGAGEENKTPPMHLEMLDQLIKARQNLFVVFRGGAKTAVLHEYMFLYLAVHGEIDGFGEVNVAMYVSDTIDNGVKSMRQNLEYRWDNSEFLQRMVPKKLMTVTERTAGSGKNETKFTDVRWEFVNLDGKKLCIRGFGASTGVRGFKEYGQRPTWCGFDDLMSDKNAESKTITEDIKKIIYRAARQAMHPEKRMQIWTGTPFNARDPLYNAAASKSWNTLVYPICENFPCSKEEFRGAWEDRFSYDFVKHEYYSLLEDNEVASFNQELMIRIISEEDRLITNSDIRWFKRENLLTNKENFNFYITTDFATKAKASNDFSVISVWAYNNNGDWFYVDGICKKQLMDKNMDDLFRLVQMYKPESVGVEADGQQQGFISLFEREMLHKNTWFTFASKKNSGEPGIRSGGTDKISKFMLVEPWFKNHKIFFPEELKLDDTMVECMDELGLVTRAGFKSKHDDFCDTIAMLAQLTPWKPSNESTVSKKVDGVYNHHVQEESPDIRESYIV